MIVNAKTNIAYSQCNNLQKGITISIVLLVFSAFCLFNYFVGSFGYPEKSELDMKRTRFRTAYFITLITISLSIFSFENIFKFSFPLTDNMTQRISTFVILVIFSSIIFVVRIAKRSVFLKQADKIAFLALSVLGINWVIGFLANDYFLYLLIAYCFWLSTKYLPHLNLM